MMHARELVELGALAATHGATLIAGTESLPALPLEEYWTASRCRLDRWLQTLRLYSDAVEALPSAHHAELWQGVRPTLEEILASESLTRVWTAVISAFDHKSGRDEGESVVRSVYIGHLEARHRALNIMVYGHGFEAAEAVALNRLRRSVERWTDLLLSRLHRCYDCGDLAFDSERMADFALDFDRQQHCGVDPWTVMLASLRTAFQTVLREDNSPNADLNSRIGESVLACFPREMFDSIGAPKSMWSMTLADAPADTQGIVRELLDLEDIAAPLRGRRLPFAN